MSIEISYTQKGDYYFPNLIMDVPDGDIRKYGRMRLNFLKEHRKGLHNGMLLFGELKAHLLEVNKQAQTRIDGLIEEMLRARPAPDKQSGQIGWVHHMNAVTSAAEEIVFKELIYT